MSPQKIELAVRLLGILSLAAIWTWALAPEPNADPAVASPTWAVEQPGGADPRCRGNLAVVRRP